MTNEKFKIPASFSLFSLLSNHIQNKSVDFSEIRTRIVGVEGKHADHLTITTTLHGPLFWYYLALYYLQTCFSLSEATFDGTQQSG